MGIRWFEDTHFDTAPDLMEEAVLARADLRDKVLHPVRNRDDFKSEIAKQPFPVQLTDTARSHPAFAGDAEFWQVVPPVLSVFSGVTLAPGAQVLVNVETPGGPQPRPEAARLPSVAVGVRQQCQVASPLHCGGQLALVLGFGAGNACRHQFATLADIVFQQVQVFVVDLQAFGGETAELTATEKT